MIVNCKNMMKLNNQFMVKNLECTIVNNICNVLKINNNILSKFVGIN